MPRAGPSSIRAAQSLTFAEISCLCLGVGLLLWGVAPAVSDSIVTGKPATLESIGQYSLVLLVGVMYLGFYVLIGRRTRWALWAALGVSLVLFVTSAALAVTFSDYAGNTFLIVLSLATACSAWLGLEGGLTARSGDSETARPPQPWT